MVAEGLDPARLHGVDALEGRVATAATRVPGATVACADVRALPHDDGSFGLVTLLTVLSSLRTADDVRATLAEAARVTAVGGVVAFWEPRVPTPNRNTRLVPVRHARAVLGDPLRQRSLTVLPSVARRLGPTAASLYPVLARIPLIRTHRLVVWRRTSL